MMDAAVLRVLSEPRRRDILRLVWEVERTAGDIAGHFAVTRPAISQHLRVLREAGLVTSRKEGTKRFYKARGSQMAELGAYLERLWARASALSGRPISVQRWTPDLD